MNRGGSLVHTREHDSTLDDDIRRCIGYETNALVAVLGSIIGKQSHLQPVAVVDEPMVEETSSSGAEHALYKRRADNHVASLVQHYLWRELARFV